MIFLIKTPRRRFLPVRGQIVPALGWDERSHWTQVRVGDERSSRSRESAPMSMHVTTIDCIPCARSVPGRSDTPEFAGPGYTLPKDATPAAICHRPYFATPNEIAMADSPCLVAKCCIVFRSGDCCCTKSIPGEIDFIAHAETVFAIAQRATTRLRV